MSFNLQELTDPQRDAAEHIDGPLLILAGPGSGKTRVVTHRIANLLQKGVASPHILALTFTNKAADEMRRRVEELAPGESVWISTFHRFCSRLLREHAALVGLAENFTIFDSGDSDKALKHALQGLDDLNLGQIHPSQILKGISDCKQKLITAENYRPVSRSKVAVLLTDVYPAYQNLLKTANAVDFDDLLLHTVELLRHNPILRGELDERYRYVLVDEYQDTNPAQYAIARGLSMDFPNLSVTGDPDQSIYGWRGADIKNILGFERDYPDTKVVRLEHNFRSTPEILSVADELIKFNKQRRPKSLLPVLESGERVAMLAFPSQVDEAQYIAEQITERVEGGQYHYRDFAIFYRINALSRYLEHTLSEHKIPFQILNGVEFYQRKEVKDIVAYLQLVNNSKNDIAFLRTVNTPPRGLGKTSIGKVADYARQHHICMFEASREMHGQLTARASKSLKAFVEMIEEFQSYATSPVEEVLGHILSKSGYEEFVADRDQRADEDRGANIRELLSAARQFDMYHDGCDYLDAFLEQSALVSDTDAWEDESDKVTLMTLHGSKGLEFPCVFIVAVEHGKLPHERSRRDPEQLEEERRLFFVGITRAQKLLALSYAKYRDYRGQLAPTIPSQFLMELPRDQMEVVVPDSTPMHDVADFGDDEWQDDSSWRDINEDTLDDDAVDFDPSTFGEEPEEPKPQEASSKSIAAAITTAANLMDEQATSDQTTNEQTLSPEEEVAKPEPVDPNVFTHGMRVKHPEYGLGKIVALSGEGTNRTATVNFVTSGEHRFILAYSTLQPA